MKIAFIIQGEGRGHLSQAMTAMQILEKNGHQVVSVFIGKGLKNKPPEYAIKAFGNKVKWFHSPSFILDKNQMGLKIIGSFLVNLFLTPLFVYSILEMGWKLLRIKPDMVINFYDLIGGLMNGLFRPAKKYFCIGHHFYFEHPDFSFPTGRKVEKYLLKYHNQIVSMGATAKVALSFRPGKDVPGKKLLICPPLIRDEIKHLSSSDNSYILAYTLYPGFANQLANAIGNLKEEFHLFSRSFSLAAVEQATWHNLGHDFTLYLAGCKFYLSSAGFDSICEAMYLGKPVYMVPTRNHYEQYCNAIDAQNAGAGKMFNHFSTEDIRDFIGSFENESKKMGFRIWADQANELFLKRFYHEFNGHL